MTDDLPQLVQRLRNEHASRRCYSSSSLLCDAATALDTLTRALAERTQYVAACEAMIREHATAADIFQPGGRFHKRADLILGRSAVVEGIAWLVKELDAAESTLTAAMREARAETCLYTLDEDGTPHSACGWFPDTSQPYCAHCGRASRAADPTGEK